MVVLKVRDGIHLSLLPLDDVEAMLFLIRLTTGINFWENCDSTSQCHYSFASEKLMSTLLKIFLSIVVYL